MMRQQKQNKQESRYIQGVPDSGNRSHVPFGSLPRQLFHLFQNTLLPRRDQHATPKKGRAGRPDSRGARARVADCHCVEKGMAIASMLFS